MLYSYIISSLKHDYISKKDIEHNQLLQIYESFNS